MMCCITFFCLCCAKTERVINTLIFNLFGKLV